jgi:hypothetical protein
VILSDAFRTFYRLLASELDVRPDPRGAAELVVEAAEGFPDEDVLALGQAVALGPSNGLGVANVLRLTRQAPWPPPDAHARVVDIRGLTTWPAIHPETLRRSDQVVIRHEGQGRLGAVAVKFDLSHKLAFEAVTSAFSKLAQMIGYQGPQIEIPARYLAQGFRKVAIDFDLVSDVADVRNENWKMGFIETISSYWRYNGRKVDPHAVMAWLCQFKGPEEAGAIAILTHLHAAGYYMASEITNTVNGLIAQHAPEAQLVALQKHGKSEGRLLYEMRKQATPIAEAMAGGARHMVCIDDVIGSGETIATALFEDLDGLSANAVGKWLTDPTHRISVLAAVASTAGISVIEKHPRSLGRVQVIAGTVFDDDGVFSGTLHVFPSAQVAATFRQACRRIGETLNPEHPLGWRDCAWAVVTEYNVPDCTLPVIWRASQDIPWEALFPRR